MKAIDIIKCLCYENETESRGIAPMTNTTDTKAWAETIFGQFQKIRGTICAETEYLYSYSNPLISEDRYKVVHPDVIIELEDDIIYLYKID